MHLGWWLAEGVVIGSRRDNLKWESRHPLICSSPPTLPTLGLEPSSCLCPFLLKTTSWDTGPFLCTVLWSLNSIPNASMGFLLHVQELSGSLIIPLGPSQLLEEAFPPPPSPASSAFCIWGEGSSRLPVPLPSLPSHQSYDVGLYSG